MLMIFAGIALCLFAIDMVLKYAIEERLEEKEERPILGGKVLIRRVHNEGACLNVFQKYPDKVMWSSVVLGILLLIYDGALLLRRGHFLEKFAMMLFTGGAFSNIADRVVRGYVVDYIGFKTKWPKLTRITYNIGDFGIFTGAILICLTEIFRGKH